MAELALVHAPALGGKRGRRFQEIALEAIAGLVVSAETGEYPKPAGMVTASAIIGMIACQVRRGEDGKVLELADEMVQLASLGTECARRESNSRPSA